MMRSGVIAAFIMLLGLATAEPQEIPVVVYHRFHPTQSGPTTVRTGTFEEQLTWLNEHHYHVIPLHKVIDALRRGRISVDAPAVAITVDDGHISVYTQMWPVIQQHHVPVTLFIYPSAISNVSYALTWKQLRMMQESGLVDVQSHTYWHPNFLKEQARLTPDQYRAFVAFQLTRSKDSLTKKTGGKVDMLAWPFGIYDSELEQAAARAGYHAAFAYTGGPARQGCDLFAIPRIPVSDVDQGARFAALIVGSRSTGAKRHE
jgi:peptidoglycan/xylan/chitin deacetylase (PgdA/CDA1 family)